MKQPRFWASSSSRFKRILTVLACFFFCILVTIAGILTPLSAQDSQSINNDIEQIRASVQNASIWQATFIIFQNNVIIDMIMFIPFAGPAIGSYVLYNTGQAVNAESNSTENNPMNLPAILVFLLLFISPHTWLEFAAYSTALASSLWLTWRIIQRKGKRELTRTAMFVAICVALLLIAAFVEAYLIQLSA